MKLSVTVALLGALASIHTLASSAHAEDCKALLAPSGISLRDTGFDQNRVACAFDGYSAGVRAQATIDTPNFYGTLGASLMLDYHWVNISGFEFSLSARAADYRFAQSAVFTDGDLQAGPLSFGVLRPLKKRWWNIPTRVGHSLRFDIPRTNLADNSVTVSASPSLLATLMPSSNFHVHGRISALLWSVLPEAGADSRAALLTSLDASYAPASVFSLVAGAELQGGWYGLGLDHLQGRAGLRFGVGSGAIELSAASVVAGSERSDLVAWIGYRYIAPPEKAKPPTRSKLKDWATGSR